MKIKKKKKKMNKLHYFPCKRRFIEQNQQRSFYKVILCLKHKKLGK